MKLIYVLFLACVVCMSCTKKDQYTAKGTKGVVDEETSSSFEELSVLINLKDTNNNYIAVRSVDSVRIFINSSFWSTRNSASIDLSNIDTVHESNIATTAKKLSYLIVAPASETEIELETLGDYSQYINELYTLEPGQYLCFIESLQFQLLDGTTKRIFPMQYAPFEIKENTARSFAGEFEIQVVL